MPGLNPLVETLALGDGSERRLAALTLGRLEDARAAGPLCHALADDDPAVRAAAMEALYRLGARALHALSRSLRTGPQRERYHTAALLGEIGGPEAAAALLPALQDTDPDVRWQAVVSLGRSRDLSVISSLGERITDPVAHVRRAAAQALGALRTAEAVLPLLIGLADPDSAVADAAATALASIGAPAVEPLCQALDSTSPAIRLRAARTLGLVGNRDALPALQARLPVLGLGGERHGGVVVTIRTAIRCIEESTHQIGGLPRTPRASEPDLRARPRAPGASREETGDPPR